MVEPDAGAWRRVVDRLAVRELLEHYADAVIRKDGEAWRATWSGSSAEWHIGEAVIEGTDAMLAYWSRRMAEFDRVMFRVSIGVIDVDGDTATARSYTTETFGRDGLISREVFGRYDDLLRREAGEWRFARRAFSTVN